ncbi:MAG: HAMP domain-containing sensor histidine kinase [Candidatus Nealsonbacteria bacterium]|nr:HAMP domain-containing sensor histidine kinase [Candidatus Nealsonbacteria bacterium]
MIEFSLINQIFVLLINFIGLGLIFLVYLNNRKAKLNQIFSILTIFIILWISLSYISDLPNQVHQDLIWIRLNLVAVILFFVAMYFFSIYFPQKKQKSPILDKIILTIGIIFSLLSLFTDFFIKDIEFKKWGSEPIFGKGESIFFGTIIILTFLILWRIFKKYFKLPQNEKLKVQYFLIGLFLFALFNFVFNVIVPIITKTYQYYRFGDYSAFFLLGFTAYAIVARRLFDIKVILTEVFTVIVALILFIQAIVASSLVMKILNTGIFLLFCLFGYFLVKSVIREVELRQEVERLSQTKSEFISIASHQLRTPLTAVKGYISMILDGTYGQLAEKQAKPLENVYQSNERLIRLVNDLLNLSRLDAGKIEFSPELISLEEMVSDIIEELRINAEKKGLYIKMVKPQEPLPKIMVDQDKLRQVILNIVDNAIKYTKEGGVTFELKKLDEQEEIKVSDTGEGMDEKELNSLFQMFSRATAGTQLHAEGAGLGLYVARQFIEMHGGKIWAESPGKRRGSTFYIQLPIHLSLKLLKSKTRTIINKQKHFI